MIVSTKFYSCCMRISLLSTIALASLSLAFSANIQTVFLETFILAAASSTSLRASISAGSIKIGTVLLSSPVLDVSQFCRVYTIRVSLCSLLNFFQAFLRVARLVNPLQRDIVHALP